MSTCKGVFYIKKLFFKRVSDIRRWLYTHSCYGVKGRYKQSVVINLVVALPNGRPCEDRIILKEFAKLREDAGLPKVVFHSLRHSSTTYKLKLNHGDLKATQGDTGHAEIDMITSVYAHILDEDRKINAQKFESAFYANPNLRAVRPPEEPKEPAPATLDLEALVEQLRQSPELANTLAALLSAAPGGR